MSAGIGGSATDEAPTAEELRAAWPLLAPADRLGGFRLLPSRPEAEEFFLGLSAQDQEALVLLLPAQERRSWVRLLDPDDAADLVQAAPPEERSGLLSLFDEAARREVTALLAFAEDDAGGLMNPRFARVRPDMTVEEAIRYLRKQATERLETLYYAYVLDAEQRLLGVVSLRGLFAAAGEKAVREVMREPVSVREELDQEQVGRVLAEHDLLAVPVLDADGRMKGIVTVDDIVDVVQEEATEDIQRLGATQALDAPYLRVPLGEMLRKRGVWLLVLFFGEMLTASAMAHFEHEIARAVVLALFIPLIVSAGGNAGAQASTLVVRAMALGEVGPRDALRVARREILTGLSLGTLLGVLGFLRIAVWEWIGRSAGREPYGEHYALVGLVVGISVVGVVLFGTVAGAMLPFVLRRFKFDPASASAPFVATLVDVTGLVIYFTVASAILAGTLL
jgi:magnesium transporter